MRKEKNTSPAARAGTERVSLDALPLADLHAALLTNWVPDRIPVRNIQRGLSSTDLSGTSSIVLGTDWTEIGWTSLRTAGGRPVQLFAQLGLVSVPASTTAAFAFSWDYPNVPVQGGNYGQAALVASGPLTLTALIEEATSLIGGLHTVQLLGRSIGTGQAQVVRGADYTAKAWAYEL